MLQLDEIRRLCVIVPHPDDESLGCGGLIALLAQRGCAMAFAFVTDGGASHRASKAWPRGRLAAERRKEALQAIAHLGVEDATTLFLDLPDAAMPAAGSSSHRVAMEKLAGMMSGLTPDLILLPWRRDPHCDHRDSWQLAHEAMRYAGIDTPTLEYAIWLDELGTEEDQPTALEAERVSFDITTVRDLKLRAVHAHLTQTTDLIDDDPTGFRLTPATIARLVGSSESYWRPVS